MARRLPVSAFILIILGLSVITPFVGDNQVSSRQALAAPSPPSSPSGTISPATGVDGTIAIIDAIGFSSNSTIVINFDGNPISTNPQPIVTNSTGGFEATITVPASGIGIHFVNASDQATNSSLLLSFNETTPEIALSPSSSNDTSSTFSINGTSFRQNAQIVISLDGNPVNSDPANVVTNANGTFSAMISPPSTLAGGTHLVRAIDAFGNSANGTYTIVPAISLNPSSAGNSTIVSVTGSGFAASSHITISYSGTSLQTTPAAPLTNSSGKFSASFRVPPGPPGVTQVKAMDSSSNVAIASFNRTDTSSLTVLTEDLSGSNIQGYFTLLLKNGTIVSNGFSPVTFALKDGLVYQVEVSSFNAVVFDHWQDTNTSDDPRTISILNDTQIVAVYGTTGISLSPPLAKPSSTITIAGNTFNPNTAIHLKFDGNGIASVPSNLIADSNGNFVGQFIVPSNAVAGKHFVTASDGSNTYVTDFTVSSTPIIFLAPSVQSIGNKVTVQGEGFSLNSSIVLKLDAGPLSFTTPASVNTNSSGSFQASFSVPQVSLGLHTVSAVDSQNNSTSAQLNVTDTSALKVTTQDMFGNTIPGMSFGISYSNGSLISAGFSPSTYNLKHYVHYSLTMNNFGPYVFDHWLENRSSVNPRDVAITSDTQLTAVYTFSTVVTNPSVGPAGSLVKISGNSFTPNSSITISFDNAIVASTTSDSSGKFGVASPMVFTIPSLAPGGLSRVQVVDGNGITYSVPFYVGPSPTMTVSPTSGPVGSEILVKGINFAPNSRITLGYDGDAISNDPGTIPMYITTDSSGSFVAIFEIPSSPEGVHMLTATDSLNDNSATQFTVLQSVQIFPTSGHAGTILTIPGSGFAANSSMSALFDGAPVSTSPTNVQTNGDGEYSGVTMRIPLNSSLGVHTITIKDGNSPPNVFNAAFNVTASSVPIFTLHGVIQVPTFEGLTEMSFIPDNGPDKPGSGSFMVAIKDGGVVVAKYTNGAFKVQPVHFVDVPTAVGPEDEGLLGMVVDPNWISTKHVYLFRSVNVSGIVHNEVIRYTAQTDSAGNIVAAPYSMQIILDGIPGFTTPTTSSHNAGHLKFDSKGNLYIATGDNFLYYPAQDLTSLGGKFLKIMPLAIPGSDGKLYSIPPSNPFANSSDHLIRKEIFSYGLRNPFSFDIDPVTGQIFVNQPGFNSWETIINATAPTNFGWPAYEGPALGNPENLTNYSSPIYWYPHQGVEPITGLTAGLEASTGGAFYHPYNGSGYPSELDGAYFFGDFGVGFVKALLPSSKFTPVTDPISGLPQWQTETIMTGLTLAPIDLEVWHGTLYMTDLFGNVNALQYFPTDISLKPSANPAGTVIVVNGQSYPPSTNVTIYLNRVPLTTPAIMTTAYGTFAANITIPSSAPAGTVSITAAAGSVNSSASFYVIPSQSRLFLNPVSSIAAGNSMTISGKLIAGTSNTPIGRATIFLSGNGIIGISPLTVITKSDGSFSTTGISPGSAASNWIVSGRYLGNSSFGGADALMHFNTFIISYPTGGGGGGGGGGGASYSSMASAQQTLVNPTGNSSNLPTNYERPSNPPSESVGSGGAAEQPYYPHAGQARPSENQNQLAKNITNSGSNSVTGPRPSESNANNSSSERQSSEIAAGGIGSPLLGLSTLEIEILGGIGVVSAGVFVAIMKLQLVGRIRGL